MDVQPVLKQHVDSTLIRHSKHVKLCPSYALQLSRSTQSSPFEVLPVPQHEAEIHNTSRISMPSVSASSTIICNHVIIIIVEERCHEVICHWLSWGYIVELHAVKLCIESRVGALLYLWAVAHACPREAASELRGVACRPETLRAIARCWRCIALLALLAAGKIQI